MPYRSLATQLHATADAVIRFCSQRWGIPQNKFQVEVALDPDWVFVPTLSTVARDHYQICIEVSSAVYPGTLDSFVLDCKNKGFPVKLYIAIPSEGFEGDYRSGLAKARSSGVGLIEVAERGVVVAQEALPLSLTGLRAFTLTDYPAKYRQTLSLAIQTFHGGNPSKACSDLYDELEALTRRIYGKVESRGWWQTPRPHAVDHTSHPWAGLTRTLIEKLKRNNTPCSQLTTGLLGRVLGVTPHRNESGHRPRSVRQLQARDLELRTRFETAADLLKDLASASRPLRL